MFEDMTFEVILQRMLDKVPSDIDKREGSMIWNALAPAAVELAQIYINLDINLNLAFVNTSTGEYLDRITMARGVTRKPATKAKRKGLFYDINNNPFDIPLGSRFTLDGIGYSAIEMLASGEFLLECEVAGSIGNTSFGDLISVDYIMNLGRAELTDILTPGTDEETDDSLKSRYYEHIRVPATSGNRAHYKQWAKEVQGVGDVKVFSLWNGPNTVKVVIIDENKLPADASIVSAVQEYIDPGGSGTGNGAAPIGAFCTVASAASLLIDVEFTATKDANYTDEQRQENVEQGLKNYFKSIAFIDNKISYAKVGAIILDSPGITDYTNLRINGGTENILIGDEQVASLGVVTIA